MYAFIAFALTLPVDETPWLPSLDDLGRFPDLSSACEQVRSYQTHLEWVERISKLPILDPRFGRDYWSAVRQLTIDRMLTWELLAESHGRQEGLRGWGIPPRAHLDHLRQRLGEWNYKQGIMPPIIPVGIKYPALPVERMPRVASGANNE